jgi:hypothetical protein
MTSPNKRRKLVGNGKVVLARVFIWTVGDWEEKNQNDVNDIRYVNLDNCSQPCPPPMKSDTTMAKAIEDAMATDIDSTVSKKKIHQEIQKLNWVLWHFRVAVNEWSITEIGSVKRESHQQACATMASFGIKNSNELVTTRMNLMTKRRDWFIRIATLDASNQCGVIDNGENRPLN